MSKSKNRITGLLPNPPEADTFRGSPFFSGGLKFVTSCESHYEDYESPQPQEASETWSPLANAMAMSGMVTPIVQHIAELTERVQYLESLIPKWQESATYFEVQQAISTVESITRDTFGEFNRTQHEDHEEAGQ